MRQKAARVTEQIVQWIRERVAEAGAAGTVVALSGGIDAAVTVALCQRAFPNDTLGVIMPCYSDPEDEADARLHAEQAGIPTVTIDLSPVYDALLASIEQGWHDGLPPQFSEAPVPPTRAALDGRERLALANVKPRLRMTALYYVANRYNYLVVGTENRSELVIGYFTKHGDGGVDILPIANLVKTQVYELARYLGVPDKIIDRTPGAGLWPGQTDEGELGLTYDVLDEYILTGVAPLDVRDKIDRLHRTSEHKRQRPPIAPIEW